MNLLRFANLICILIVLFCSSCGHLLHLNNAQSAFNRGANLENKEKFGQEISDISPDLYYNLAYAELQKALKSKGRLKKDGVLASTYTMKALCEWKLHRHELASETAKIAIQEINAFERAGGSMPRDKAMMEAIDWLVTIDEANESIGQLMIDTSNTVNDVKYEYQNAIRDDSGGDYGKIELALERIDGIKNTAIANQQTLLYLQLSQMAGLKVWSDGLNVYKQTVDRIYPNNGETRKSHLEWYKTQRKEYSEKKQAYLEGLIPFFPEKEEHPIYKYWELIL